ncbi:RNA polymerase sigma factor [Promicromonospora kroppenstedtii]|uniref:RNA polymerase sigma factor n=1 Tax=Promicromonospora kroppenstedtii TaxID=440482 RepID=A0ABW7XR10_9MICO
MDPLTDQTRARAAADAAARASYGRLLALLAARDGDIQRAEDALAGAFERALTHWPADGVPTNPDGWLLAVARNRLRDVYRSAAYRTTVPPDTGPEPAVPAEETDPDRIGDRRLELMFVCAHPAIEAGIRTPLMLQTVLGVDAADIAAAFAVPAPTMAQRLVRAKRRIRDARIPFRLPARPEVPARLPPVLEAVYGAYAIDWRGAAPEVRGSLTGDALTLALLLADLLPEPEALGLAALLCFSLARADAREDDGVLVPLDEQDVARWDGALIERGEALLRRALGGPPSPPDPPGRFRLEAAIQSVHCARARTGRTDWPALVTLHRALVRVAPTLGGRVALAAVVARVDGAAAGLAALDEIAASDPASGRFQPLWATRAHLLAALGADDDARAAYDKARSLTTDPAVRAFLVERSGATG